MSDYRDIIGLAAVLVFYYFLFSLVIKNKVVRRSYLDNAREVTKDIQRFSWYEVNPCCKKKKKA